MADMSEVVGARIDAERAVRGLEDYGGQVEDGARESVALAVCLAADAICARLLSLEMTLASGLPDGS